MTAEGAIILGLLLLLAAVVIMWRRERTARLEAQDGWGVAWEQGYADGFAFGQLNVLPRIPATTRAAMDTVRRNQTARHTEGEQEPQP